MRKIMALAEIHGDEAVACANAEAMKLHAIGSDYIANILDQHGKLFGKPCHKTRRGVVRFEIGL